MLRLFLLILIPFFIFASEVETICMVDNENLPEVTQMINESLKVGLLLVQFSDHSTNDDARGSVGWDHYHPSQANKVYDKYHYQDYWNIFFSFGTYHDIQPETDPQLHPDAESHGTGVWGSFKDYWWEVSRQNLEIIPAPTREPGNQLAVLDGTDNTGNAVANGLYIYQLRFNNISESRRLLLLC